MGYWEQFGEDNRRYRARRATMPTWRRRLQDAAMMAMMAAVSILFIWLSTAPLWQLLKQ